MSVSIPRGSGKQANSIPLFCSVQEMRVIDGSSREMHIQLIFLM